jgi:hypothetical protein
VRDRAQRAQNDASSRSKCDPDATQQRQSRSTGDAEGGGNASGERPCRDEPPADERGDGPRERSDRHRYRVGHRSKREADAT